MNQEAVIGNRDLNFIQRYNWGWKRSTALPLIPILEKYYRKNDPIYSQFASVLQKIDTKSI
jgi:hypothetical protein